jgi:glycosyltransferase involved in cell wall biosynthesis
VRILYFADIRFPLERANGIQTMETCYALAGREHAVQLVVRPDTHVPSRDPFDYYGLAPRTRLVVEYAPVSGPDLSRRIAYLAFAAGRAAGRTRADVVLTRDLAVASLLLRFARTVRPPLVYESHGYAPDVAAALPHLVSNAGSPSPSKLTRLARREAHVWQRAEGYVTITAGLSADLTARFGSRSALAVVPDGTRIDATSRGTRDATGDGRVVIGYAGHLYPWKGVDVLLEALAQMPEVRGIIVGGHEKEPDLARLKTLAGRLGIENRVTFTGWVPPRAVPQLLARADVLVLPNPASAISTRSTSPLKLFEYLAAGRAIVASDLPSIREVLRHEIDSLLVAPGDAAALASAIRRLSQDEAFRLGLSRRALESAADYTWERRAERLESLFHEVTSSAADR